MQSNQLNNTKSPTKTINISPKPNQKNTTTNNQNKKKLPFFNIVEPTAKNNKNIGIKNDVKIHTNNNNNTSKLTTFDTLNTGITPKIKLQTNISKTTSSELDDNLLDDIHDYHYGSQLEDDQCLEDLEDIQDKENESYQLENLKLNTPISGTESELSDAEDIESLSGSESDTGISSSDESNVTSTAADLIPILSSSHMETIKISNSIKLTDFKQTHLVGKGGFGKVHQVIHKTTSKVYALKTIKKNHIIQRKSVLNTLAEKDILKRIEHPFIVKLHYAFQNEKKLYLVMDFINGGQLFYHLQKEKIFSESQVRFYIAELVLAIEHLHELNIIHRDLKPENILLDNQGHCVLTDFGLAKEEITDDSNIGSICGTFEYMSPEMIQGKTYGKAVDWWSIGILMFDMLCGKPPFESKNRAISQDKIIKEKPKYPNHISSSAKSLMNGLLHKDPKLRLGSKDGAKEIKKHPFFKSIQWRKLELKEIPAPFIPKTKDISDISNFDSEFLKEPIRESFSASPSLSTSQQAFFDGFSFVRTSVLNLNN